MIGCLLCGEILLLQAKNTKRKAPNIFNVKETKAHLQAGFWILTRSLFDRFPADRSVENVCKELQIGRSAAYDAATQISKLLSPSTSTVTIQDRVMTLEQTLREKEFIIDALQYELEHPGDRTPGKRTQFDLNYKIFVEDCRQRYGLTFQKASDLLGISIDTLKKFPSYGNDNPIEMSTCLSELPQAVLDLINEFLRSGQRKKSLRRFCDSHPELLDKLNMNYRQVLYWFRKLGFVNSRGIFLSNKGLDRIIRFKPNQVWGTDGKMIPVIINGQRFRWVWQCLMDGKTKVIVGGVINKEENTQNLLDAIIESGNKTGITPMAIVMDNRLSENMPAIRSFLDPLGIQIINTFPGNSKSNADLENNFKVFDQWVGQAKISGTTLEELSRSVAQLVVEIFTQMRNRKPRTALSGKNVKDIMDQTPPASPQEEAEARQKIKALADRLKNKQSTPLVSAQKKAAIQQAINTTHPTHPDVFEKTLQSSRFTPDLILQSLAIFERQKAEFPEKKYDHTYFGGILRNKADQQSVECLNTHLGPVYANHWEIMGQLKAQDRAESLRSNPHDTCTRLASDFMNMPIPAFAVQIIIDLKESFFFASKANALMASKLRQTITDIIIGSKKAPKEKRETLLCKLFEWENFIRLAAPDVRATAPAGLA